MFSRSSDHAGQHAARRQPTLLRLPKAAAVDNGDLVIGYAVRIERDALVDTVVRGNIANRKLIG